MPHTITNMMQRYDFYENNTNFTELKQQTEAPQAPPLPLLHRNANDGDYNLSLEPRTFMIL